MADTRGLAHEEHVVRRRGARVLVRALAVPGAAVVWFLLTQAPGHADDAVEPLSSTGLSGAADPATEATQPVTQPVEQAIQPVQQVQPATQPVQQVQPATQPVQQVQQATQPVQQATRPVQQATQAVTQPVTQQVHQATQQATRPVQQARQVTQQVQHATQPATQPATEPVTRQVQQAAQTVTQATQTITEPPTEQVIEQVTGQVTKPAEQATQTVEQATRALTEQVSGHVAADAPAAMGEGASVASSTLVAPSTPSPDTSAVAPNRSGAGPEPRAARAGSRPPGVAGGTSVLPAASPAISTSSALDAPPTDGADPQVPRPSSNDEPRSDASRVLGGPGGSGSGGGSPGSASAQLLSIIGDAVTLDTRRPGQHVAGEATVLSSRAALVETRPG